MSTNTITITDSDFEESVGGERPVMVDFWAEWCGPCRLVAPILDEIAVEYRDKITVAKLNVDDNPRAAEDYGVMSIPTLIVFKEGVEKKRIVGARPKQALLRELTEYLV